ncbi:hypothetical protein VTN77DRAFT_1127 [Rasamsonia byssochlamydoides]|uniref:uncharacterized protein n=1 Tax=Rasamsonia byssochlamydoides TaxID=89139 RepID=UPI0037447CA6
MATADYHYLYVPSPTERGPMNRYDLNLTGMPCFFGCVPEWAGDRIPDTCVFCSEFLGPQSSYRRLLCGHFFHLPCIDKWICNQDASCPMCRRTFYHLRRRRHVVLTSCSSSSLSSSSSSSAQIQRADLRRRTGTETAHHRLSEALNSFKAWLQERGP